MSSFDIDPHSARSDAFVMYLDTVPTCYQCGALLTADDLRLSCPDCGETLCSKPLCCQRGCECVESLALL
jgi:hypothetical protein